MASAASSFAVPSDGFLMSGGSMPDLQQIGGWALVGGLVTTLAATWRLMLMDMRRDRDFWRDMALGSLGISEKAVTVAETAVKNGTA